jgi:hypothetical protein
MVGCGDNGVGAAQKKTDAASPSANSTDTPVPVASTSPTPTAIALTTLDPERLKSRDCKTVLSFYADTLHAGLYEEAARVWGKDRAVSAATLERRYSAEQPVSFELSETSVDGGAGSLYCEVAAVLKTYGNQPRTGKITLRRVNDVPGATADQLRWHITDSTFAERDAPLRDGSPG